MRPSIEERTVGDHIPRRHSQTFLKAVVVHLIPLIPLIPLILSIPWGANTSASNSKNSKSEAEVSEVEVKKGRLTLTLTLGRVSDNPKKHYHRIKPMADYVVKQLKASKDFDITEGRVLMAKNNQELIQYLKEEKVDWVTETPFSAVVYAEATGAEIILRNWKKKVADYYAIIMARKDSAIDTLSDLKGKKIAFEDPGSTMSYFIPLAILKGKGLDLVQLSSPRETPPSDKVGYLFAGGEVNISTWVHKRLADAGALSNLDWEDPSDTPKAFKKDLKIIYQSKPYPRSVEILRQGLEPRLKKRIKKILLEAHKDKAGEEALKAYQTTKFEELDQTAIEELDEIRQMLKYVQVYKELK